MTGELDRMHVSGGLAAELRALSDTWAERGIRPGLLQEAADALDQLYMRPISGPWLAVATAIAAHDVHSDGTGLPRCLCGWRPGDDGRRSPAEHVADAVMAVLDVSADQPTWIEAAHAIGEMIADGRYDDLAAADQPSTGERCECYDEVADRVAETEHAYALGLRDGVLADTEKRDRLQAEVERLREAIRAVLDKRKKATLDAARVLLAEGTDHGAAGGDQ